jgi:RecA/RadA recombinase
MTITKEQLKKRMLKKQKKKLLTGKDFVSTGSTLLNLAISGNPYNGFAKGLYYLLAGDTQSGKTFLSLTCFAEAALNKNFNDYEFIYDNVERGALMDISEFFGEEVEKRMIPPAEDEEGEPIFSESIEEFYDNLDDWLKDGKPFIYILDSADALTSESEIDKFEEQKKDRRRGKEVTGYYTDGKARINSSRLRQVLGRLSKSGSILIIINQTRANIGGYGKTRSGGWALEFYACIEIRSSLKEDITKTYQGNKLIQGHLCRFRVKKNRVKGKDRSVYVPIYDSYGVDDIGSCVDYLIKQNHWKTKKQSIVASEFDVTYSRDKLINYIIKEELEKDLQEIVGDVWKDIEDAIAIHRPKRRYK